MNSQIYKKKYKLNSEENEYLLQFESLDEEQIIRIILIYNKYNQKLNFSIEKDIKDIIYEFRFLKCNTTKELVDYLSALTKKDQISINKKFTYMNIITFFDNDNYIQFNLRRKIDDKENRIEEIEDEILNIYNKLENLEDTVKNQEKITNDIKEEFQKKYENLESKLNNPIIIGQCLGREISITESNLNNSLFQEDKIMKDNNNNIKFNSQCYNLNKKDPIYMESQNEECDFFTAFNLKNNDPMIAWIIRKRKNIINIINMKNKNKFYKKVYEDDTYIECLQYFYNYNDDNENKEFIISLSKGAENNLIVWKINNGDNLSLYNFSKIEINHKINVFTMLSYINYQNKENYIFLYDELWNRDIAQKGIHFHKINNNFRITSTSLIEEENKVLSLDTYYDMKVERGKKLYLIDCNSNNVTLFENPFTGLENKKTFKERAESNHLCGFIVERNNNLELFESNYEGINIWDIDNNNCPKLKIQLNQEFPFNIGIWNDEYFWVVTTSGSKFFQINENIINEKKNNFDILKGSKIQKIIVSENESIVKIDSNRKLCLWYKEN